jgi:hypothetical protein
MQYNLCVMHMDVFSQVVSCDHAYVYVLNVGRSKEHIMCNGGLGIRVY